MALNLWQDNINQEYEAIGNGFISLITGKIDALKFSDLCLAMDIQTSLSYIQMLLMDMMRSKNRVTKEFLFHPDKAEIWQKLCATIDLAALFNCYDKITTLVSCYNNNLNKQLLLEDLGLYLENMLSAS